jgi:FlaA1/EpsC-like NDP-sugar epimerase
MVRNRYILLADLPLIGVAAFGAFALRFDLLFAYYHNEFFPFLLAALILKPIVYFPFGMYSRYWRYGTAQDLVAIVLAVSASSVAIAVLISALMLAGRLPNFARPILMIDWLLTLALAGGLRMSVRVIGDAKAARQKSQPATMKNVLIVGAGEAGLLVAREIRRNPQLGLLPVAFLDDAESKHNKQIQGVPVRGPLSSLDKVLKTDTVDEVIIAMPTASGSVVRGATDACRKAGVAVRTVPGVFELLDDQVSISRLRKVEISDLLRRPQVATRSEPVAYLKGKTVLITGAGGSIGSELSRQVAFSRARKLVILGHGENSIFSVHAKLAEQYPEIEIHPVIADIRDAARLRTVFERFGPDVVFHAAAHKHVPLMELNPEEAFTNNVRGTQNVLEAAGRCGAQRFVLVSTDKAVAPSCIMGASKRLAEALVVATGAANRRPYVVVRFGNVLGSRGSVVPTLQRQIERGGPVTVTHPNMKRFFMTIPEAVHLVLHAGGLGEAGDLFVLNMGEQLLILDLARDLIRLSGLEPEAMPIAFTGIRPGEKLEETLWEAGADVEVTSNADILRVREHDVHPAFDIRPLIEDVALAAESGDLNRLQTSLELVIPTYTRMPVAPPVAPTRRVRADIKMP